MTYSMTWPDFYLICFAVGDRDALRIAAAYGDPSLAPGLI